MTFQNLIQIAGMILIPILVVLIPIFLGQYYGVYIRNKSLDAESSAVGTVVGAALGLLAFMLGFTFQIANDRYERRKGLLLEEVTNIRTVYLQADLLPEPYQSRIQKLMVEYVDLRVAVGKDTSNLSNALARSSQILDTCWLYARDLSFQDRSSDIYALYITTVSQLFANFNQRITLSLHYRIPRTVLWILFIITFLSMFVLGYQFGVSGRGSIQLSLMLSAIFSMVILLIIGLDRPRSQLVKLNQTPVITLQQQLKEMQLRR